MSFLGKLFEVMSYYTGVETPMANDSVIMDTWDELEEEEQRKYLKSLLYGAVIAVTLATGYHKFDVLFGDKLEAATDNALKFMANKSKSYFIGKSIDKVSNDLLIDSSEEYEVSNEDNDNTIVTYIPNERKELIYDDKVEKITSWEQAEKNWQTDMKNFRQKLKNKKAIILNPAEVELYNAYLKSKEQEKSIDDITQWKYKKGA